MTAFTVKYYMYTIGTAGTADFLTVFSAALDKARELNVPLTIRAL